jgi:hypothetical protein
MATSNYSWNLPTVGGSEDTWGAQLNANWTALDTLLGGTNSTEFAILDGATVTTAELNYLSGVTGAVQTQINGRAATSTLISAGDGLTGGGDLSANRTISHADTSSQESVSNSGSVCVQSITLDTYGHVTGITSATVAPSTAQVLSATAGASVGEVGSYAFLADFTNSTSDIEAGSTVAGSNLRYASDAYNGSNGRYEITGSGTPAGTWRVMGYGERSISGGGSGFPRYASVWLRIS